MTYQLRVETSCTICNASPVVGRRLCRPCYQREWKAGTLKKHKLLGPNDVFESRIIKSEKCWMWTGHRNSFGYGIFLLPGEKDVRAHRYAYEFYVGKIPRGKIIMHICDNPGCVNPAHLRVGTRGENNRDTANKKRHNYGLMHWNGKLSNEDVKAIRDSSEPHGVLAKRYGVSQPYISRLKSRERRE